LENNFGTGLKQMETKFPLSAHVFSLIHQTRNEQTYAHYKNKKGILQKRITLSEFDNLLKNINLKEAYEEIFEYYEKNSSTIKLK
jgi:hypothetical protein